MDGVAGRTWASMAAPAKNFVVIMKDGKIYKNLIR
jgi:hypothetical protein